MAARGVFMAEAHPLAAEIARLTAIEQKIIDRFIHSRRDQIDRPDGPSTLGERVADRVASFGGSWPFIFIALGSICVWIFGNALLATPLDAYPIILLNLVLSCLAALQAPIIMMSQNRQSARDRIDAQHDYEVNMKAELEIVALHAKLDEIREQKWSELMEVQQQQIEILRKLTDRA
jgi:uncharacterized membrane protein